MILVTGGAGFIGANLIKKIKETSELETGQIITNKDIFYSKNKIIN